MFLDTWSKVAQPTTVYHPAGGFYDLRQSECAPPPGEKTEILPLIAGPYVLLRY